MVVPFRCILALAQEYLPLNEYSTFDYALGFELYTSCLRTVIEPKFVEIDYDWLMVVAQVY